METCGIGSCATSRGRRECASFSADKNFEFFDLFVQVSAVQMLEDFLPTHQQWSPFILHAEKNGTGPSGLAILTTERRPVEADWRGQFPRMPLSMQGHLWQMMPWVNKEGSSHHLRAGDSALKKNCPSGMAQFPFSNWPLSWCKNHAMCNWLSFTLRTLCSSQFLASFEWQEHPKRGPLWN